MTRKVELRRVTPDDLPALAELERACFTAPWDEDALRLSYESPVEELTCAICGGDVCGYLCAAVIPDEAEVLRIAVSPRYRRMGIARQLLRVLTNDLRVNTVFLEVRFGNTPARALYAGEGFQELRVRKNYYDNPVEDGVIMSRTRDAKGGL